MVFGYFSNHKINIEMDAKILIILTVVGILAGIVGGMSGVGGGVIVIPALVYVLGFSQQGAQGTSLAMMLPPIGIIAVYNYYKAGYVNVKYALIIGLAFVIGSYFGSKISINLPEATVKKVFACMLIVYAAKLFTEK